MEMNHIVIYVLIVNGLFYFSEGKPCPEKTRPHKTRCEAYYKCRVLPSKMYVWIPAKCEKGLVYEHSLKMCVLPGEDWECILEEEQDQAQQHNAKGNKHNDNEVSDRQEPNRKKLNHHRDGDYQIVHTNEMHQKEGGEWSKYKYHHHHKEVDYQIVHNNSNNDKERETNDSDKLEVILNKNDECNPIENNHEYEASGDGDGELNINNNNDDDQDDDDNVHNAAAAGDGSELLVLDDLMPVQTRQTDDHILSSAEEKDEKDSKQTSAQSKIDPNLTAHLQRLSQLIDGLKEKYQNAGEEQTELRPDQLNAFLAHFNIKNKFNTINPSATMDSTASNTANNTTQPIATIDNKSDAAQSKHYINALPTTGYASSQIVVNRPDGSVLFGLTPYASGGGGGSETHFTNEYIHHSPKISEDTLKTVLELSKQMIATQNIPKVIPNPQYYPQPILQPVFFQAPGYGVGNHHHHHQNNRFAAYYNNNNGGDDDDDDDGIDDKATSGGYKRPTQQQHTSYKYGKPSTTIIHNNVIPVHVATTNSGEKEIVDSYGQSLGLYPPLGAENGNNNNHHHHYSHRYENNKYITVTTVRPAISTTPYPTEISVTTAAAIAGPFDFKPTAATIAEYYTPSPHLSEDNANKLYQGNDRYNAAYQYENMPRPIDMNRHEQPSASSYYQPTNPSVLFPTQIDPNKIKIRPNAHKIESMEVDADDFNVGAAYNYNNENPFVDQINIGSLPGKHHPYMPRPQGGSSSSGGNKSKFPTHSTAYPEETQLVNIGGNFISYEVFQNTILPLMGGAQSQYGGANVEVITCAPGVRQPNTTDCTRYYVCSKKDGKVLSYSCPPYTAFNPSTRICDARSYSFCSPDALVNAYSVSENKRIQLEAIKALQEAKRRREQAIKTHTLTNLLQQYNNNQQFHAGNIDEPPNDESNEKDMLNSYIQQAASLSFSQGAGSTTTMRPSATQPVKKRKYYCKEGDKIADQTSINSYFVCYKNAQGMMKGHKMTCSKGLLFCPKTTMCTLASKCS